MDLALKHELIRRDEQGFTGCERCETREATVVVGMRDVCADCTEDEVIDQAEQASERQARAWWSA